MPRVGPLDARFGRIIGEHNIVMISPQYKTRYSGQRDLDADRTRLRQPRPAAEHIPDIAEDFIRFKGVYTRATEEAVRRKALQPILGPDVYNNADNLLRSNLSSMTSDLATQPRPNYL